MKQIKSNLTTMRKIRKFIIYKLLCPYHNFFMKLSIKLKLFNFYSYHRELYEQADFVYGRYKFLKKLK